MDLFASHHSGPCLGARTRCVFLSAILALACPRESRAAGSSSAQPPLDDPSRSAILRAVWTEWSSYCPCPEDCVDVDTVYCRLRAGDALCPTSWASGVGCFSASGIDPHGRVSIVPPPGLRVSRSNSWGGSEWPDTLVLGEPLDLSTQTLDAGTTVHISVVDSLPLGAVLGARPPRERKRPHDPFKPPLVMRHPAPDAPRGYHGPWGTVDLQVWVGPDGAPQSAQVTHGVSPLLDSLAVKSAMTWEYSGGQICEKPARLGIHVWVVFSQR